MSEGDVSLIRDEDVLRRMWQQTEDFSRKKEIRAHMYRLREERLRNLYSPEPTRDGKGSEFSAAQGHVKSFADQSFQSMKSKEVRDAGSPPKEFTYRGEDLKALSNAGWNVESENKTTDDGHTHVKSVHANIEGRYDVDGGKGQFAAVDHHKEAVTEYHDDNSSLKRNETSSNTAAREHVVRQTDDGTHISSSTSSSTATSKFQQTSSTKHDTVPYLTNDDFDLRSYDTNRNEDSSSVTRRQIIKTNNDYEQNVRKNDYEHISRNNDYDQSVRNDDHIVTRSDYETGELVSRKVDYPDDNTRVVVETRCLPDGTRVTSTKREFRAPVQSTRSEHSYQTRENKSYSTQQRSNSRDSTKIIRNIIDNRTNDIVDSQRNVDEYDFKRQIADYTTQDKEDYSDEQRVTKNNRKVIDYSKRDDDYSQTTTKINKVNKSTDNDEYVQTHRRTDQRRYDNTDVRRETIKSRDEHPAQQKDHQDILQRTNDTEEKIHHVTKEKKVEEVVEKKQSTDQYQTTYQTDFPQKKISNDWSPSHQAWASTLRADTPSTTRPSTRASSPGSKTFKSSTSSLRSSVSPDKTNRKPNSRGGSPNKIDRYSPTRTISDKYSSTHSTHSSTEVKTNNYSSPEDRRPPSGRSPTRPGYSPERKPQDYRQRPSLSPDKKPHDSIYRHSVSPDRKPLQKISPTDSFPRTDSPSRPLDRRESPTRPRSSPERKPAQDMTKPSTSPDRASNGFPRDTSKRPSQSPERKPSYQKPTDNRPTSEYPRTTSPSRPFQPADSIKRPDTSPARKPGGTGYQPSSPTTDTSDKHPKASPPNRLSVSPDRTVSSNRPTSDITPSENQDSPTKPSNKRSPNKKEPSPSPERKLPGYPKTTTKIQEDHYKFIDEETKMYTRTDKIDTESSKRLPSKHPDVKDKSPSPSRKSPSKDTPDFRSTELQRKRSPSPKDHVTFIDQHDQLNKTHLRTSDVTEEITTEYRNQYSDILTDKNPPREQSPSKYGTYDKKKPHDNTDTTTITTTVTKEAQVNNKTDFLTRRDKSPQKAPDQPASPTKKLPRDSLSPTKSPTKDTKYKPTTDFLATERTTEEINKKTTKGRPRQLVTPSSSPTRKPKPTDTEPSTGQSSPTTSVSGFVYFSSPRNEQAPVTDLDDQEYYSETQSTTENTTFQRPESLDVKRSPSPSKIPCRSPTPEKRVSPSKDVLPRKSSLKKPSSDITQASPIEKPPSSFRVSPTEEAKDLPGHKIVKKDRPEEPDSEASVRSKPPLERRETYEDRCRKILGMMEDTTKTETITKQATYLQELETNLSSPSVSPCRSPAPKESPFEYPEDLIRKTTDGKSEVIDFIAREQEHIRKATITHHETADKKHEVTRDTSPSKLKDVSKKEKSVDVTIEDTKTIKKTVQTKYPSPRQSPEKKPLGQPSDSFKTPKDNTSKTYQNPNYIGSPATPKYPQKNSSPRSSLSPERRPGYETAERKPKDKLPKEPTSGVTSDQINISTDVSSSYENKTDDYEHTTAIKTTEKKLSRSSESPSRKVPSDKPSRSDQPVKETLLRETELKQSTEPKPGDKIPRESPSIRPGYNRTTTSMITEYDSTSVTEDVEESITSGTVENDYQSSTISEKPLQDVDKTTDDTLITLTAPNSQRQNPEKNMPKDSSPTRPGYTKTTASVNTKHDTVLTRNTQETIVAETTKTKYLSSHSPTRKTSKPSDETCPSIPTPSHRSPERKPKHTQEPLSPSKTSSGKKPTDETSPIRIKSENLPGYMKITSAVSSKYDTISTTEDVNVENVLTSKSTKSHHTPRPSESPTRQPQEPSRKSTTTKSRDDISPSRMSPNKQPEDKNSREESPTRQKPSTEKIPGYMKTTSSQVYKKDTSSKTEDVSEIYTSETVERKHSRPNDVISSKPCNQGDIPESDFPRDGSPSMVTLSRQSVSPDRKPTHQKPFETNKRKTSPTRQTPEPVRNTTTQHNIEVREDKISSNKSLPSKDTSSRLSNSPTRGTPNDAPKKPHLDRSPNRTTRYGESIPRSSPDRQALNSYPKGTSPTRKISDHLKTSTSVSVSTSEDIQSTTMISIDKRQPISRPSDSSPTRISPTVSDNTKSTSDHPKNTASTPQPDSPSKKLSPKESSIKMPGRKNSPDMSPSRRSSSPDKLPNYMRPTASVTNFGTTSTTKDIEFTEQVEYLSPISPSRPLPTEPSKMKPGYLQEPEPRRKLRSPSPIKKSKVTEVSSDFLMSEREQEILDRVQKSLRKLSPERKERSPSSERTPGKNTTSLQDIDITSYVVQDNKSIAENINEIAEVSKLDSSHIAKPKYDKPNEQKSPSKPTSRNVSPTKKPSGIATTSKVDKSPDTPSKTRSVSPKKLVSPTERPQSPQITRPSGIKPKEQIPLHLTRKPTPASLNVTKVERTVTDLKKNTSVTSVIKQNSFTKSTTAKTTKTISSPTGRPNEPETKRVPTSKGLRESSLPRKDTDTRVTRTASDITMKSKKTSPQRIKSKPEIQVSDMSTTKTTAKINKSTLKEPHSKLPSKPKSATTLNTSTDEDDIIIDVQQSKSSRENSPDRICPTPVNFGEDIGTPRYPDEVSEPDDEFRRRTHLTIHETESIVDDIVEICEDDELFVRKTNVGNATEDDESLLSVTDKVSRFTKGIDTVTKPKDTTKVFKETESRVHSDFIDEKLKSDECLLSVSEKVNKFARGPSDIRDSKSPARRVVDEYDKNNVYQDDYTKLSVHDKAHLFVETAENVKVPKVKPTPQKVERPDLSNVDDSLKSDDCLLSVSDKVHKFVKTAEQFLTETQEVEEKEKQIKEQHEKIMRQIVDDVEEDTYEIERNVITEDVQVNNRKTPDRRNDKPAFTKETSSSQAKVKEYSTPSMKPTEKTPSVKITTLRSSEAVKKAKALFENIASTTQKSKETTHLKTIKLTDIGVLKKSPKTDSTTVLHPSVGDVTPQLTDLDSEVDSGRHTPKGYSHSGNLTRPQLPCSEEKPRSSPSRIAIQSPEVRRSKSPMRQSVESTTVTTKTVLSKQPATHRAESPRQRIEGGKTDKVPGYLRPTKTSQIKEENKVVEETEVSSRRGSGKFGVELRRTSSVERSTANSERRRSVEHPCIEDIFDLDLLEQMLEKVVGYEQRRRIRAQTRIARKKLENENMESNTYTRTAKQSVVTQKDQSPERPQTSSPDRSLKSTIYKTSSPDRQAKTPQRTIPERIQSRDNAQPVLNGHAKDSVKNINDKRQRPHSPEKTASKPVHKTKSPVRQASPDKKTRTQSPSKTAIPKTKPNRFNEYASAYMKKVGLSEADKIKFAEARTKKAAEEKQRTIKQVEEHKTVEEYSTAKSYTERSSSKDVIDVAQTNGTRKRSPSPEKRLSPERKAQSPERIYERTPSPAQKHPRHETTKKETIIKTVYDIEKKIPQKPAQEDKPSWITNRNLKKISSETRTFSSKKIEEKPKYRAPSPSKVISKPIDVITSSYGPGPLDADGKPLFGIRALRNGASNYQVKGTVIRSEYHSRNGSEPEGSVSVTAYSTEPEDLERLLQGQGEPPSRIHGLAAITTTKKFGGDTGTTLNEVHGREDRAAIDQFTHSDRRVSDTKVEDISETSFDRREEVVGESRHIHSRREDTLDTKDRRDGTERTMHRRVEKLEKKGDRTQERRERVERTDDKKTVRQSSVKSLTEKYIKSANETSKSERAAYPKAGLILRTATMKDSVSSDSSAHAGLARTDSEHSLASVEDTVTTERVDGGVRTVTTTTRSHHHHGAGHQPRGEKSFLDSSTKVTGVQDILTRMKNADIVIQEGDTSEDTEARALLNKFLGATVLMAGMQGYVSEKPSGKLVVKQETVRTSSSGGKVTSSQTRNLEEFDVDQCWDERLLRKLLDECNDYEQRRRLRARIRSLMAEQEACASAVTEALAAAGEADGAEGDSRGESLLLPLLQGLLGGGGERLLAGLGAAPADVVADVRRSLGRLRAALAPPTAHPQARALLSLADRLEDALDAADRLDGCRRRPRRRSRAARHTVGVTHEELEEARRLVDRDHLALAAKPHSSSGATSTASIATSTDEPTTPERKQSIDENSHFHDAVASRQKPSPVAHSVSYEAPKLNRDARVIVEKRAPTTRKPDFYRHSSADTNGQLSQPLQPPQPAQPAPPQPVQPPQPQLLYQPQPLQQSYQALPRMDRRPSDSKSSIAAIANKFDSQAQNKENIPRRAPVEPATVQQKEFKREDFRRAPLYMPLPPTYNFAAPPSTTQDDSKPLNRFGNSNNKRLRMKRANTIDIGRPLAGYRIDSDNDDETSPRPAVPEFRPQTENDRKFVAFMKKNEAAEREPAGGTGQANWSNRFGNIKNAFESREREDNNSINSRSSSASSARRFWRAADETTVNPAVTRPKKFGSDNNIDVVKPPWVHERREPVRVHIPRQMQVPPPAPAPPMRAAPRPAPPPAPVAPAPPPAHPQIPQSPTKPLVVKPFVARPIPVNQFSHAPMSAFKPPSKVTSPTAAPAYMWSPPSVTNVISPTVDNPPAFPVNPVPIAPSPPAPSKPWANSDADKPRRVVGIATAKIEGNKPEPTPAPYRERPSAFQPTAPPTHALLQNQNYPVKAIPSQNDLSAPELVRKADDTKFPPQAAFNNLQKVDAQKLQIEFYEKQIREKNRREPIMNGHGEPTERKPPPPPAYTITDFTPAGGISTFVPLQRTPDIEKARAHKIDYLPDVVTNDTDRNRSGTSPLAPHAATSPYSPRAINHTESPHAYQNGDVAYTNGTADEGVTTEHDSVVTRVMRGPVRGAATITTGVRTRNDEGRRGSAADSLRGALDKLSFPKNDVITQIDRKKRETTRSQVRAPVNTGRSPLLAPIPPHVRPSPANDMGSARQSPGALAASRESVFSSESAGSFGSNPLSRSGSWHQIAASPKPASPRRVVARAKSMHLLAVPKLYEGGIAREEVTEKKRTVEAYFAGQQQQMMRPAAGAARPRSLRQSHSSSQSYSLGRSRTMPTVSELQFLDESNTEDAFEDLVSALA